jgi:hypothetical protein
MILVLGASGAALGSQDAAKLIKDAQKELRQAERDMFGGKKDKAIAALEPLKDKLLRIKAADPNNPGLKTLESKYKKLVKDLERRTGKDLGGGTLTAAGSSTATALPPKPEAKPLPEKAQDKAAAATQAEQARPEAAEEPQPAQTPKTAAAKLPYHARRPLQQATRDLDRIDSSLAKMSDSNFNKKQLLENMKKSLESARNNFDVGKAKAAEENVSAHPDFDAIEMRLRDAEKKIAEAEAGHAAAQAEAAAGLEEINADVKILMAEYDKCKDLFDKATGYVFHYNDLEPVEKVLTEMEAFEQNNLATVKKKLEAFGAKYGTTAQEIDAKADSMGYTGNYRASFAYTALGEGIHNIGKTRTVMADDLIRRARDMQERTSAGIHDFARKQQHERIKAWAQLATRYDAQNPRVQEFNSGLEAWIAADMQALETKIDKAVLPQQPGDAPADAAELARAAKEFLQKEEDRRAAAGKEYGQIARVVVTGPWRIFKKNILGEPIQYNLPIASAVQIASEKDMNLMRVYLMTMLTEEMKGVKKAPPFVGATVGDSYYIRPAAVR